jgi:hypothetical protein
VDQAALRAAKDCGLEIGGWCPPGRACEAGVIPFEFPLQETDQERSRDAPDVPRSQRTEWNVRDSDGVLVITADGNRSGCPAIDPGTDWAIECAARYQRPLLICDVQGVDAAGRIRDWLRATTISTLSVGGPSESTSPGIGGRVSTLLKDVFAQL